MEITVEIKEGKAVIALAGRFDFSTHGEFTQSYAGVVVNSAVKDIEIDLTDVDYIDSSALGMLLLSSERAKLVNKTVSLANPNEVVAQVLDRVSFGKIFAISR